MTINHMRCCGTKELTDIGNMGSPERVMRELGRICYYEDLPAAHVVFTGVVAKGGRNNYARKLAKFITDNGLGAVVSTPIKVNPNTHNPIQAYLWTPNKRAVKAWWKAHTR